MNEKEQAIYDKLLSNIEKQLDADPCCAWTQALKNFADAVETMHYSSVERLKWRDVVEESE